MECLTCTGARRLSPTRRIEKPSLTVLALSHSIIPLSSLPSRGRERSIVTIMSDFITSAACRSEQTLPRPQDWSLYLCCLILIPSLILLSSLLNDCFSVGIPGSDNKETGFERLWTRIYTTYWRSGGKKQQEADGKESSTESGSGPSIEAIAGGDESSTALQVAKLVGVFLVKVALQVAKSVCLLLVRVSPLVLAQLALRIPIWHGSSTSCLLATWFTKHE